MMAKYNKSYNKAEDWLPLYVVVPPCFLLALVWNEGFTVFEVSLPFFHVILSFSIFIYLRLGRG